MQSLIIRTVQRTGNRFDSGQRSARSCRHKLADRPTPHTHTYGQSEWVEDASLLAEVAAVAGRAKQAAIGQVGQPRRYARVQAQRIAEEVEGDDDLPGQLRARSQGLLSGYCGNPSHLHGVQACRASYE